VGYLRGFIPWIVFAAVSSADWRWAAVAAVATGCFLLAAGLRGGVAADALILDISTVIYFVPLGAVAFADPHSALQSYDSAMSFAWLCLTAWLSLALRKPFTLGIAKRQTPREYWHTPGFLRVNVIITAVWAVAFTLTGAALVACAVGDAPTWLTVAVHVVGLASPAVFTSLYPRRVQARLALATTGRGAGAPAGNGAGGTV
jgi:hypothetical protein